MGNGGDTLLERRTALGFSQESLAAAADTTKTQISKLEKGERQMTPKWAMRLAPALKCRPDDLYPLDGLLAKDEIILLDYYRNLATRQRAMSLRLMSAIPSPSVMDNPGQHAMDDPHFRAVIAKGYAELERVREREGSLATTSSKRVANNERRLPKSISEGQKR